ncbi:MAG: histidinol-phosphate aminotransferase family protein [Firmicutes bacterium]|nr:histidinol-phosphate aminotransferase family protein [Bacillota bacterium]
MSIIERYLPEKVRRIEEYVPNEAIYPIRLDANESPYQPSPGLRSRFAAIAQEVSYNRYPDPAARALISAFCSVYGVEPDCVAAGNGSDELISILYGSFLAAGDKVMILSPDFSMYSFYDGLAEAQLIRWEKADLRSIDFEAASALASKEKVRMVIFSNPCNPTGVVYDRETILNFVKSLSCLCVVDEAYMDFSPQDHSVMDMCGKVPNLIVLKTLSKMGLAALRVGFAVSGREIAAAIRKVKSSLLNLTALLNACPPTIIPPAPAPIKASSKTPFAFAYSA